MRCEFCNRHTVTYCSKCNKFLCLHEWRNCYWDFHGGSATENNSETEEYDSEHVSDADVSDVETGDQQPVLSDVDSGDQQTVLSDLDISEQPVENAANDADVSDVETGDQQTVLSNVDILTFMNSQLKMLLMKINKI